MADRPKKPLTGQVAFVTGGAKRLGQAAALALAESGANVAITFLQSDKEAQETVKKIENSGVRALAVRCDVTDSKSVREAIATAIREFERLDILINNAGRYETVRFDQLSLRQWDTIFATNVRGPFLVSKEALPHLRKRKGRIINLGSL